MKDGFIYIMFMSEMPHCLKVGRTVRDPEIRAKELSGTSSPLPFRILMKWRVKDVAAAEKAAHDSLAESRINPNREFFRVSSSDASKKVGEAIKPFLYISLSDDLLDTISSSCQYMSNKFFKRDIRTQPAVATHPELYQQLSEQFLQLVLQAAYRLIENDNDPRVIISMLDVIELNLEGPTQFYNSPESLYSLMTAQFSLLESLMRPEFYLMIGSDYLSPGVLDMLANISRTISRVIIEERPIPEDLIRPPKA